MFPEVLQEQAIVGDGTVQPPAKVVDPEALVVTKPRIPFEVLGPAPKLLAMAIGWADAGAPLIQPRSLLASEAHQRW